MSREQQPGSRARSSSQLWAAMPPLPSPFTVDSLVETVSTQRGRPIEVVPWDAMGQGSRTCGAWVSTPTHELIFVAAAGSQFARDHIVIHEIAHMVLGHTNGAELPELWARLFPDIDPEAVTQVLGRGGYTDHREVEAEMLASQIQLQLRLPKPRSWSDDTSSSRAYRLFNR